MRPGAEADKENQGASAAQQKPGAAARRPLASLSAAGPEAPADRAVQKLAAQATCQGLRVDRATPAPGAAPLRQVTPRHTVCPHALAPCRTQAHARTPCRSPAATGCPAGRTTWRHSSAAHLPAASPPGSSAAGCSERCRPARTARRPGGRSCSTKRRWRAQPPAGAAQACAPCLGGPPGLCPARGRPAARRTSSCGSAWPASSGAPTRLVRAVALLCSSGRHCRAGCATRRRREPPSR